MTTQHDCGGPVFGRKTAGCPRCDELINGAPPVKWNISRYRESDAEISRRIKSHDCTVSRCGPVCTAFEW